MILGRSKRMYVRKEDVKNRLREKALAGDVGSDGKAHVCLAELAGMAEEEKKMILEFDKDDIELCLNLLNGLTISGISNAEKVAVIGQRLQHYTVKEEKKDNGDHTEKE